MKPYLLRYRHALALSLAIAVLASLPGSATAGCLREFGECGDCAEKALKEAIWDLDLGGITDAWIDGIDCDLDFYHCLVWGQHHSYGCGL